MQPDCFAKYSSVYFSPYLSLQRDMGFVVVKPISCEEKTHIFFSLFVENNYLCTKFLNCT